MTVQEALARHGSDLMALAGVVGVGEGAQGDGAPCILVLVAERTEALVALLPEALEGFPVLLEVTGGFGAHAE